MFFELELCFFGVFFAVALICGILLWRQRNEVPDRSRTYFSLLSLLCAACSIIAVTGLVAVDNRDGADALRFSVQALVFMERAVGTSLGLGCVNPIPQHCLLDHLFHVTALYPL